MDGATVYGDGPRRAAYDVVVVGGGPAGLSGAVTLARSRRSVLVVDAGQPRNAVADGVHAYLGLEGLPPGELLARGRRELRGYGGEVAAGAVTSVTRVGGTSGTSGTDGTGGATGGAGAGDPGGSGAGFRVTLAGGRTLTAARLLVTTGLTDRLPAVPGLAERFGRDVLHCPYCHGWEMRDQPVGVLATGPFAVHQALLWRQLTADVTLFLHTGPEPSGEEYEQLAARNVAVVDGEVTGLALGAHGEGGGDGDRLAGVVLAGGRTVPVQALAVAPYFDANADLLGGELGLTAEEFAMNGHPLGTRLAADPMTGATAVPGVWAAGNVTSPMDQVISAAAAGVRAGAAINADLVADEARRAVAARRGPVPAAG